MYKIRKIQFDKHPILGNLLLNFCDINGNAVDTVILAGENGTGKSTILNELYNISSYNVKNPCKVEFENGGKIFTIIYSFKTNSINNMNYISANDNNGFNAPSDSEQFKQKYKFNGIYSDVDINFNANELRSVTSLNLDSIDKSRKSTNDLPTQIKQLLIDIQALDDVDISNYYSKKVKEGDYGNYNTIVEFKKMEFCDYICSLEKEQLKLIFSNLKSTIEMLIELFQDN